MSSEHISGYLHHPKCIEDFNHLYTTTINLVELLGMEILDPPKIIREEEPLTGNSVFCVIKTSHLAFHFMENPEQTSRFTIDSCKLFDKQAVIKFLEQAYKCKVEIKSVY